MSCVKYTFMSNRGIKRFPRFITRHLPVSPTSQLLGTVAAPIVSPLQQLLNSSRIYLRQLCSHTSCLIKLGNVAKKGKKEIFSISSTAIFPFHQLLKYSRLQQHQLYFLRRAVIYKYFQNRNISSIQSTNH